MEKCLRCNKEFNQEEVKMKIETEEDFEEIYEVVDELYGLCEKCANVHLDALARAGAEYLKFFN